MTLSVVAKTEASSSERRRLIGTCWIKRFRSFFNAARARVIRSASRGSRGNSPSMDIRKSGRAESSIKPVSNSGEQQEFQAATYKHNTSESHFSAAFHRIQRVFRSVDIVVELECTSSGSYKWAHAHVYVKTRDSRGEWILCTPLNVTHTSSGKRCLISVTFGILSRDF